MKCKLFLTVALMAMLLVPIAVKSADIDIIVAGKYDATAQSGGFEVGGLFDLGGRFFIVGQGDFGPAKNGVAGLLGVTLFASESVSFGLLGGPASQWYALSSEGDAAKINYIEGTAGAFFSVRFGERAPKIFLAYQYTDPLRDVAIDGDHSFGVGLIFPVQLE